MAKGTSVNDTYQLLDDLIVSAIKSGLTDFARISEAVLHEARRLEATVKDRNFNRKPAWRYVDTRLQALRKSGRISFTRQAGWSAVQ